MAKSFAETHPRNLNATCECEHWQSCIDCHPTAHSEKYITDAMRVRQAVAQAVLHEPAQHEHAEKLAKLGWQYFECPACGSEGAGAFPKPAQRKLVGLTDEERKLVRNSVGYNQFVTAGEYAEHVQKATEFKLLEKNT